MLSGRSSETIRTRIETLRGNEEQAVLTPMLRDAILAWIDAATAAIDHWPLDPFDLSSIAAQLTRAIAMRAGKIPDDWSARQPPRICIRSANASSTSLPHGAGRTVVAALWAGCGSTKPSGCAAGSASARTSKCCAASPSRISPGALALAAGARLRGTPTRGADRARGTDRASPVRGAAKGVPAPARDAMGRRQVDGK